MAAEITVGKLKKILNSLPDDKLVILAQDGEGNTFSPAISATEDAVYVPHRQPWQPGEVYSGGEEPPPGSNGKSAFVLWPTH